MWVHQYPHVSSNSSTCEPYSVSFQLFWCHPHVQIRIILVFDEQKDILNSVLFAIQVRTDFRRIVFPTTMLRVGVHTNFVREEPLDLQCLTMIFAMDVLEDVSIYIYIYIYIYGHSDFGILSNLGASSNFTWVYADTASAACQSGNLAIRSTTFTAIIWDADEPCSVKTA